MLEQSLALEKEIEDLNRRVEESFGEYEIKSEHQKSIKTLMDLVKLKDKDTWAHTARVGLLGARIARFMHLDPKPLIFAGYSHDEGKIEVPIDVLTKTESFTEKDMKVMRRHPIDGYRILRDIHPFSAEIVLRHHTHQKEYYPKRLPKPKIPFSRDSRLLIEWYSRLLALVDTYDSAVNRVNEKFGAKRKLTEEEVKAVMLLNHRDLRCLVEELYANGILGEGLEKPTTKKQDLLYDAVWEDWKGIRTPEETQRHVTLACALEPLSYKQGCTTRATDISKHLKLEYFLVSAINIGDSFRELAKRVISQGSQPNLIYDSAYKAQQECAKNRGGGRINQGTIEMLIPIVAAQTLYDSNYQLPVNNILEKAVDVMKKTSTNDVKQLIEMKKLAYDLCGDKYKDRQVPVYPDATNIYDYYRLAMQNSRSPTSVAHNTEFVSGFQATRYAYDSVINSKQGTFERKVEEAYSKVKNKFHKGCGHGLTADCIAATLYLIFSTHPKDKIVV